MIPSIDKSVELKKIEESPQKSYTDNMWKVSGIELEINMKQVQKESFGIIKYFENYL
jgi:hypothetical protein